MVPPASSGAALIVRMIAAMVLPIAAVWAVLSVAFRDFAQCSVALVIAALAYRIRG